MSPGEAGAARPGPFRSAGRGSRARARAVPYAQAAAWGDRAQAGCGEAPVAPPFPSRRSGCPAGAEPAASCSPWFCNAGEKLFTAPGGWIVRGEAIRRGMWLRVGSAKLPAERHL